MKKFDKEMIRKTYYLGVDDVGWIKKQSKIDEVSESMILRMMIRDYSNCLIRLKEENLFRSSIAHKIDSED